MSDLDQLIEQLKKEDELAKRKDEIRSERDDVLLKARNEQSEECENFKRQLVEFFRKLKQITGNIIEIYPNIFTTDNTYLFVNNAKIEPEPFDYDDFMDLVIDLRKNITRTLNVIFNQTSSNPPLGDCKTYAKSYNTIVEILLQYKNLSTTLIDSAVKEKADEFDEKYKIGSGVEVALSPSMRKENEKRKELIFPSNRNLHNDYLDLPIIPIGFNFYSAKVDGKDEKIYDKPLVWDLSEQSVFYIDADEGSDKEVSALAQDIVLRFIESYPTSATRFAIFSPKMRQQFLSSFQGKFIQKDLGSLFFRSNTSEQAVLTDKRRFIDKFENEVNNTIENRMSSLQELTITEFNEANQEVANPLILLVIDDYTPSNYSTCNDALSLLFDNGAIAGIYALVIRRADRNIARQDRELVKPYVNVCHIFKDDNDEVVCDYEDKKYSIVPDVSSQINSRLDSIKADLDNRRKRDYIPLQSILTKGEYITDDFSKTLRIPIGRASNSSIQDIVIRTDSSLAHTAVAGKTGSGKSSLLQDIILGGAYIYSPEQLEFWILDFKDGSGLSQFDDLKHVKMMSIKNRPSDALEIMEYIIEEKDRRASLTVPLKSNDISDYNEKAKRLGRPLLTRLLIIIDEFTNMPQICQSKLKLIAEQGRSYGMGLILSGQNVSKTIYAESVGQTGHRFEYINDRIGNLLATEPSEANRTYVNSAKGNVLYGNDNDGIIEMRVAFAGPNDEQIELVHEINEKWADYERPFLVKTGSPEIKIKNPSYPLSYGDELKEEYLEDKKLFIPIGETHVGSKKSLKFSSASPYLVLFGDDLRSKNIEYTMLSSVSSMNKKSARSAYYLDLNDDSDRPKITAMSKFGKQVPGISYHEGVKGIASILDELYKEFVHRNETLEAKDEIGLPIILSIHYADNLIKAIKKLDSEEKPKIQSASTSSSSINVSSTNPFADVDIDSDDFDLGAFLNADSSSIQVPSFESAVDKKSDSIENISYLEKFKQILMDGYKVRIFVALHYVSRNEYSNFVGTYELNEKLNQFIVVPSIPIEKSMNEKFSDKQINEYLSRISREYSRENSNSLERMDFFFAHLVNDGVIRKIIPYEYVEVANGTNKN